MRGNTVKRPRLLIVDDDSSTIHLLASIFDTHYNIFLRPTAKKA